MNDPLPVRLCRACNSDRSWRWSDEKAWHCMECGNLCQCLACVDARRKHESTRPSEHPKHKASERLRALATAACGTGRPAISSPDMRVHVSWEQLELVATELEKMGL